MNYPIPVYCSKCKHYIRAKSRSSGEDCNARYPNYESETGGRISNPSIQNEKNNCRYFEKKS